jgi:3-oxoacyl-[acyl-carrier protein] reductase
MDLGLDGKVAIVTGGAAGIGAAIAAVLAREGCDVAIVDREPPAPEHLQVITALGHRALVVRADVRDRTQAEHAVATVVHELGRLDILVCNAGVTADATIRKMSDAQWDDVLDVNLKGCFNYIRAAAETFMEQRGGKIVALASINGLRGKFGQANYAASKAGVIALGKTAARELGKFNVNVNVVAPGLVATQMTRSLPREVLDTATAETVLGRVATPGDCAEIVAFLCSDRARHVTGQVIQVDGGQYI